MKTPILNSAKTKFTLVLLAIFLCNPTMIFAQNKFFAFVATTNPDWLISAICVTGLALFLFAMFIKQKNN